MTTNIQIIRKDLGRYVIRADPDVFSYLSKINPISVSLEEAKTNRDVMENRKVLLECLELADIFQLYDFYVEIFKLLNFPEKVIYDMIVKRSIFVSFAGFARLSRYKQYEKYLSKVPTTDIAYTKIHGFILSSVDIRLENNFVNSWDIYNSLINFASSFIDSIDGQKIIAFLEKQMPGFTGEARRLDLLKCHALTKKI